MLRVEFGETGFKIISFMIAVVALTSINATIIVGARSNYALGRDWPVFAWLGTGTRAATRRATRSSCRPRWPSPS